MRRSVSQARQLQGNRYLDLYRQRVRDASLREGGLARMHSERVFEGNESERTKENRREI